MLVLIEILGTIPYYADAKQGAEDDWEYVWSRTQRQRLSMSIRTRTRTSKVQAYGCACSCEQGFLSQICYCKFLFVEFSGGNNA